MSHEPKQTPLSQELASGRPERDAAAHRDRAFVEVTRIEPESDYVRIWVEVPAPWRANHVRPAQYVTARFGESRHRFLVIANAPEDSRDEGFELLVEPNDDLEPVLEQLELGSTFLVSAPEGRGFPTALSPDGAYLFATGSGIAAIRPLLTYWASVPRPETATIHLFYEESPGTPHAYRDELEQWVDEGWLVADLVADPRASGGHIDERFTRFVAESSGPGEGVAMLAGSAAMIAAVTDAWLAADGRPEAIHTNI